MDPMIISLIASAVMGQAKSSENWKNYQDQTRVQAMKDRTAGLTGRAGTMPGTPSMVDPMFQSLLTGAMMGQQLSKKGTGPTTDPTSAAQPSASVGTPGGMQSMAAASSMNPYSAGYNQAMQQQFPWAMGGTGNGAN